MEYLTVNQVVARLGVHRNTVEKWLRSGELRGVRLGGRKLWRIPSDALDDFMKKGVTGTDVANQ